METTLDIVLIIAGIIWSIVFLAILAVVLVVFLLARRYLTLAHTWLRDDGAGMLSKTLEQAEMVNARTAWFAGRVPPLAVPRARPTTSPAGFRIPFLRRRRPWWQRLLGR